MTKRQPPPLPPASTQPVPQPGRRQAAPGDAAYPHAAGQVPSHPLPDLSGYRPATERTPPAAGYEPPSFGSPPSNTRPPQHASAAPPLEPGQHQSHLRRAPVSRPRPPRPRRRWLRGIAYTFGGLVLLAGAAAAALVVFAPVGIIRDRLAVEVKARTGRDLRIAGPTSLTFYPSLGVTMSDVSLSAPPQMGGGFVTMRRLEAYVPLFPLLSRKVEVDRLVLTEPVFDLRVDRNGRRSWDFAAIFPEGVPRTIMVAQAPRGSASDALPPELQDFVRNSSKGDSSPAGARPARSPSGARIQEVSLGDVSIANGTVRYRDERSGLVEEVRAIDARLTGRSLASPLDAKGAFDLRGDRVEFEAKLTTPRALLEDRPVKVALAVGSPRAAVRYQGGLTFANGTGQAGHLAADGTVKLDIPSVRELVRWLGVLPSALPSTGPLSIEGDMRSGPTWVSLSNGRLRLDELRATGSANVDVVGGRPNVKAALDFAAVDLNPYLNAGSPPPPDDAPPAAETPQLPRVTRGGQSQSQPQQPSAKQVGPQVKGFTGRSGWREDTINLLALAAFDADLKLGMTSLAYRDLKLGASRLSVSVRNGRMRTTFDDVRLYGGVGRGLLTLEPTASGAAIGANIGLDGVSALPFLKDWSGFDWVDGKGKIQLGLAGQGPHQRAIMESLNGKADFTFADGAIIGYDVPKIIKGLSQGRISGLTRSPNERTEFSDAGASFLIRNGIAETKDLRATSPLLRMTGAGTANLGQRQIDMILRPRLGGGQPPSQQTGQQTGELTGLELPVRLRGAWERPSVTPDMDGILKNPGQAIEALRDIGRQIQQGKGGNLNQLIDQFRRR